MNILCLGCSWTADRLVSENPNIISSWVSELANQMPQHNFYNCAYGGTSLLHSIYIMEKFLEQQNWLGISVDKIIFQITNEGRVTYYKDLDPIKIPEMISKKSKNYFCLEPDWTKIHTVNYGVLHSENRDSKHPRWEDVKNFARVYYSALTRVEHFDLEHKILIEYVKSKADIVFFHKRHESSFPVNDATSIQDILGDKKFNNYVLDNGCHFNLDGIKWQADYIKSLI